MKGDLNISDVAKATGLTAHTLRYYERIGLLPGVTRTTNGVRNYSEQDCARVQFVKCMRNAGMSIEALIEYMQLFEQGEHTAPARKALLEEQRNLVNARITDMQDGLKRLDAKIENYESMLVKERAIRGGE